MIPIRCAMILPTVMVPAVAVAGPIWSMPAPEGWTDVSTEMRKDPLWVGQSTEADAPGRNLALVAYSGPGDETLAAWAYTVPRAEVSIYQLEAAIRSSRDQHRAIGTEISYRRVSSSTTIDVRQNVQLGDQVIYVRFLAGFDRHRQMHSVTAICKASSSTCAPLLLSLTLDKAQLMLLPVDAADKRSAAYRIGQTAGGISLLLLVGLLWLRSWHRRRSAARVTPTPAVAS